MMTERSIIAVVCSQTPAERERERPESRDQRETRRVDIRERVRVYNKQDKYSSYCANQSEYTGYYVYTKLIEDVSLKIKLHNSYS